MNKAHYKAGEQILVEGEVGDSAYLIVSGSVKVSVGAGGKQRDLAELGEGQVFGEMSLIDPGPRSATVTATSDTECVVTKYEEFMDLVKENPDQAIRYMQTLVQRLRQMNEFVANAAPGRKRLKDVLRDWGGPMFDDTGMTEEERRVRMEVMTRLWPMF